MSPKNKIEKYVAEITKNPTYVDYLKRACEFGFDLRNKEMLEKDEEIKSLKSVIKTYEDLLKNDTIEVGYDDDYEEVY